MKKVILFLILLLGMSSCVKYEQTINPWLTPRTFVDVCKTKDSTTYYMCCNIGKEEVEIYFAKKQYVLLWVEDIDFGNQIYHMNRDTVYIDREDYRYTPDEFIDVLINKNKTKRDTTIFKFTPNMYCSWKVFDEIYNTYIE